MRLTKDDASTVLQHGNDEIVEEQNTQLQIYTNSRF